VGQAFSASIPDYYRFFPIVSQVYNFRALLEVCGGLTRWRKWLWEMVGKEIITPGAGGGGLSGNDGQVRQMMMMVERMVPTGRRFSQL